MNNNLPLNLPRLKAGWSWVKLGDVCELIMGQSPPSSTYNTQKIGLPFFQGKAEFTELFPEVRKWCSEPNKIAEPLDILVSVRAPVGSTNITNQKCCIGRGLAAIRYPDCNKYIFYFFRLIEKDLDKLGTGTTFRAISSKTLNKFPIPLPPLPEQKKIVAKIEELLSELDNGIEQLEKTKQQLKIYRQAVLSWAFSGRLLVDEEYIASKIKDGIELIDGDRGPNYPKQSDYLPEGFCLFLSTKNVRPNGFLFNETVFISEKKHKQLRKGTLGRGDIILTTRGTVGNVAYFDDSIKYNVIRINSGMLILRRKSNNLNPKFIVYFIQSPQFKEQIKQKKTGTAQPQLPANILKEFTMPIPSSTKQHQIVSVIETRFSVADKLEQTIDENLEKANSLRQSILKRAFEGRLV